jgi:hypothetical protein
MIDTNIKSWLKYFILSFIVFTLIFLGKYSLDLLEKLQNKLFKPLYLQYNLLTFAFCSLIGIVIGFEYFLKEMKKKGRWKANIPKLILVGLPSLCFAFYAFVFVYLLNINGILGRPLEFLLSGNLNLMIVFQVIFGYVIITSFYKELEE